jgi:hypothetical protein
MDHPEGFLNLVKDAKKRIKEEDYREVKKKSSPATPWFSSTLARTANGLAATFPAPSI